MSDLVPDPDHGHGHGNGHGGHAYDAPVAPLGTPQPSGDRPQQVADADRGRTLTRRRPNWWGGEARLNVPGTVNVDQLDNTQVALYALHTRIEEIGRHLRTSDYIPPTPERSPSPEPFYGADGKRINTREYRFRKKLEDERHKLVNLVYKLDPAYRPPNDYRRPTKLSEKIYIPVREFPEINFIGLLLGPRGTTLKQMEADSGAKIAIRGKGSVKEGKGAPTSYQNQEEDLHCLISGDNETKIKLAVGMVNKIIETASTVPEAQNELKRKQLRDLAALNGTLRDDENQVCQNCGALGHKRYNCPERANFTNTVICRICGGAGHMARDCMARHNPEMLQEARERETKFDSEYHNLMAELGAGGPSGPPPHGGSGYHHRHHDDYDRRGPPAFDRPSHGGPAPWARDRDRDRYDDRDRDRDRDRRYGPGPGGPGRMSFAPMHGSGGGGAPGGGYDQTPARGGAAPWSQGTFGTPRGGPAGGTPGGHGGAAPPPWAARGGHADPAPLPTPAAPATPAPAAAAAPAVADPAAAGAAAPVDQAAYAAYYQYYYQQMAMQQQHQQFPTQQ
ncbi:hypothetical protein AMAG_02004 [Allomyces macrogynus ATCC 38327]|uniref:Branchpoint-bridging protein n=1 Tax=Allomyces macrogynus (strain ATCC 38327) TaxID=578462 RepID=A0A0L0S1D3_ALLM3|nr:hypothetical protein AMAG_02004 [Allomyces macrogynus ATCC 38327]|eukprot:KNE56169.1 hypothetical protein AMAG_02004 [Allomyces macrogynus ATCC 38327]